MSLTKSDMDSDRKMNDKRRNPREKKKKQVMSKYPVNKSNDSKYNFDVGNILEVHF